ncbi:DUF3267 domain-containing protein [Oceanobacillus massiliensis]|uniref:DUF3267 domain-containing protein n=1 Tax=Oceanobacillus massiliensis TaxID=1465765 RepID=UPI0002883EA2|nr:DUF3267 domain-containing protein [Oceanobacillus massiliensis]
MNCWKSININKEIGRNRLILISLLIGILSFMLLFVPFSLFHAGVNVTGNGLPFINVLLLLPLLHSCMNILPLIIMKKRIKISFRPRNKLFPTFNYHTEKHLTKVESLLVGLAPTLFLTIPGLAASFIFTDFYVYTLLLTCMHIGISYIDFLLVIHVIKAPKKAYIQNVYDGFDILLREN